MLMREGVWSLSYRVLLAKERLEGSSVTGLAELGTLHGCPPACLRVAGKQALGHGEQSGRAAVSAATLLPKAGPGRLSIVCFTFFLLRRDYKNPHLDPLPSSVMEERRGGRLGQPP